MVVLLIAILISVVTSIMIVALFASAKGEDKIREASYGERN